MDNEITINTIDKLNNYINIKNKQIDYLDNKLKLYLNKIIELKKLINLKNIEINKIKLNDENLCSICLENKINTCCFPCGHTYCDKCISNSNKCYNSRSTIIITNKIYI